MEYKGYIARVEYDDEAQLFHGQVMNLRDVITFQGHSVAELRKALRASIADYLAFCAARGEQPEKPFSGKVLLRLTPEIHRAAVVAAAQRRRSLNAWATEVIERAIRKK
ncbi:MAG: type II toxin-antitoxin system HicB family antitoxin [Chloroflexota bacterium]